MKESSLGWIEVYFQHGAYEQALVALDQIAATARPAEHLEQRRVRAWLALALGQTEKAYELFWCCAHHPGGRAGLLILTVLAGQVETGMRNWQTYCDALDGPPLILPDGSWHARPVSLAAISVLERYRFASGSPLAAAAGLYRALLYRTVGQRSEAFRALASVAHFSPLAALVRERWLEEIACLPAPGTQTSAPEPVDQTSPSTLGCRDAVVAVAARMLLYLDSDKLQSQAQQALQSQDWGRALELLRRALLLDPEDTSSLERRWRLFCKLQNPEAAQADLYALLDIYERRGQIASCQQAARNLLESFPITERALLCMCFLQARLEAPLALAHYGRMLLEFCRQERLPDREASYRGWLLRQRLTPDDRHDFQARRLRLG